ncbi:hypothetical protein UFOVP250_95 [uncultured Caudovirales phage]|uniref:Uncharacterized protein n=1 Tax=uncultured Caudovirales phage TaxID=2100421 RepID=A0A6J5LFC7_9CAUD|nr:hypothetical protein UFOVP250_95 [uncultured Caudovirales phage]
MSAFTVDGELTKVIESYYATGEAPNLWYDWFCTERQLAKRGKRLMEILTFFVNHKNIDIKGKYAFFKNNAPISGGTYDQVSIVEQETGKVLFCIQERNKGTVLFYDANEDFKIERKLPV